MPISDVSPRHLVRDRIVLDRDAIEGLKASIAEHGQRVPIEIVRIPRDAGQAHRYGLISGWRRLRALTELHEATGDPRFSTALALLRDAVDARSDYLAMVEENEVRVEISQYERARIVAEATARGVFPDHRTALETLFASASPAKRARIEAFVTLHEALGDLLCFPARIGERLGLDLVARLNDGGAPTLRRALSNTRPATPSDELALLRSLVRPESAMPLEDTKEILRPDLALNVKRRGRKITVTLSGDGVDDSLLAEVRATLRGLRRTR